MLGTLLTFAIGAVIGFAAAAWWLAPSRRALQSLVRSAHTRLAGDWKSRTPNPDPPSRLPGELRELLRLSDTVAERTSRLLKDLSRRRDDLRALVDALPDPLILADTRRRVSIINAPAAKLFGVDQAQALYEPLEAVVSVPTILSLFDRAARIALTDVREDGTPALPLSHPIRISRSGVSLAYQATVTRSGAGGVLVVLRDISTLDATLRMKSDFVANAGHELRTPVAAIKVAFETLEDLLGDDADAGRGSPVARCMSILGGHLLRLEDMLQDLLDLSRVESGEQRPVWQAVTVGDFTRDLRQTLGQAAVQRDITLHLPEGEAAERRFTTDPRLLMLAVKNLVENAIKYTPHGGEVTLAITPKGDATTLTVSDTGVGIAPEHAGRIFERFYQIDAARTGTNPRTSGRGTGLGLSIVKHAVVALGGNVWVDSEPGRGSTFGIRLPRRTDAEGKPEAAGTP